MNIMTVSLRKFFSHAAAFAALGLLCSNVIAQSEYHFKGSVLNHQIEVYMWSQKDIPDLTKERGGLLAVAHIPELNCSLAGTISQKYGMRLTRINELFGLNRRTHQRCDRKTELIAFYEVVSNTKIIFKPYWPTKFGENLAPHHVEANEYVLTLMSKPSKEVIDAMGAVQKKTEQTYARQRKKSEEENVFKGDQHARFYKYGFYRMDDPVMENPELVDRRFVPSVKVQSYLGYGMFLKLKTDKFYYKYFIDFLHQYSDHCSHLIENKLILEATLEEVDADGNILNRDSNPFRFTIDERYVNFYEINSKRYSSAEGLSIVSSVLNGDGASAIGSAIYNADARNETVDMLITDHGCASKPVQTVYENLLRRSLGSEPITDLRH